MKEVNLLAILCTIFVCSTAYPTCQQIQINGYLYDLSKLPASNLFVVQGNMSGFIEFSFCQASKSCNGQNTFVVLKQSSQCRVFSNQLNPMKENYTMIDSNAPKNGIKINYLPSFNSTNASYQYTTLNIHCPSVSSTDTYCNYTKVSDSVQRMECFYPSDAGCASIKLNYFWQFLSDNSIVFAILLWLMALFELFFAYLAIRMTIFIFGILTGAIFGIIYSAENYVDFIYESQGYGIGVFVICLSFLMGILLGVVLLTLPRLGYINIGLWVAVIFSLLLQNSVLYLTGDLLAFYITVGVVGLIMAGIALMKLKNYIILSTSFISAFWLVRPLGFFLSSYPNQFLSGESYLLNDSTDWQFYLYLIAIIILTILGAVFQFCCFKKSAKGNQAYYLQQEGSLKEKFKKLLEFQEIRTFIRSGADQIRFFKQLIVNDNQDDSIIDKKKIKVEQISQSDDVEQSSDKHSENEIPVSRKKTKLQKQMDNYQLKKQKKSSDKPLPQPYFQISKGQNAKKNRKVVQILSQEEPSYQQQNISQEQESEYIKPNKLNSNNQKIKK